MSRKRILPREYLKNIRNLAQIQELLQLIDEAGWPIKNVIWSLGIHLLKQYGLYEFPHVVALREEYSNIEPVDELVRRPAPDDETDWLGLVYQSLLSEGKKNTRGSYYTPQNIVRNMVSSFDFSAGQTFFDPCCGSGAFLLAANVRNPEQLFGIDNDPIAVMAARINLLVRFSNREFLPQIYCCDFLQSQMPAEITNRQFDYIATNPPWGAMRDSEDDFPEIASRETFSYFYVQAFRRLSENGTIRFLFPDSIRNVKVHRDIREFILTHGRLEQITTYDDSFSGVTTKYIDVTATRKAPGKTFRYVTKNNVHEIQKDWIYETKNRVFNPFDARDIAIIRKMKTRGEHTLHQSIGGLGIVTGDNRRFLSTSPKWGWEPIFTGKEIRTYTLAPPQFYVQYRREAFQQVAKDAVYRAPEKLVYKFISRRPRFAYDTSGSLFLNSANILIPRIPGMSMKTVLAFLNSALFAFLYLKMFDEVKILRGNLEELSFPAISEEMNLAIEERVEAFLRGDVSREPELQQVIYAIYDLSKEEIDYIRDVLDGKSL